VDDDDNSSSSTAGARDATRDQDRAKELTEHHDAIFMRGS
jgi:hypothetical protein